MAEPTRVPPYPHETPDAVFDALRRARDDVQEAAYWAEERRAGHDGGPPDPERAALLAATAAELLASLGPIVRDAGETFRRLAQDVQGGRARVSTRHPDRWAGYSAHPQYTGPSALADELRDAGLRLRSTGLDLQTFYAMADSLEIERAAFPSDT